MSQTNDLKIHSDRDMITIDGLLSIAKDIDRIMLEAVEAGIESGKSIGIIEAYNLLTIEGHTAAAEILMKLIEERPSYES